MYVRNIINGCVCAQVMLILVVFTFPSVSEFTFTCEEGGGVMVSVLSDSEQNQK